MIERLNLKIFIIGAVFLIVGCASTARLYPSNDLASSIGMLKATYMDYGVGGGKITINMPDGETLTGEYSTADTSSYGFGNVYASVYGTNGSAFGSGTSTMTAVSGSSPGVASLYGDKGTSMTCEYFVNNWTGKGAGACKSSSGALFKLHF